MCRHHLSTGRFGSLFDSAVFITFPPVIASMIEHNHLLCTGIETLLNNFRYQFRIGISCQFGHFIPTDIRFDNHFLSGFDKAAPVKASVFKNSRRSIKSVYKVRKVIRPIIRTNNSLIRPPWKTKTHFIIQAIVGIPIDSKSLHYSSPRTEQQLSGIIQGCSGFYPVLYQ